MKSNQNSRSRGTCFCVMVLVAALEVMPVAQSAAVASPPDLGVGQPFPNIVLPALSDSRPRSIADFRGRKIILHVFASW